MKKVLIVLALATCLSTAAQRFDASVFAGLNMCQIDGDRSDGFSHPGLRAGVGTSFPFGDDPLSPWRMVVELAFTNKGSYIKSTDQSMSLSYVELPVLVSYNALENRLRLAAGVAPAVCVGIKVTTAGVEERGWNLNVATFDWLPLTLGVRYLFTPHLGLEARYQYSALSVTRNTGSGTYFLFRGNKGCFHNLVSFALSYTF